MGEVLDLLLAMIDESYDRKGWHGAILRGSLRGITPQEALWRPAPDRHNIWELAVHAAYWKYACRRRLTGAKRGTFPLKGSNWFASPSRLDEKEWREILALLEQEHRQLREAIASLGAKDLRDPKKLRLIYGMAAHDTYHTGQIQLVKRLHDAQQSPRRRSLAAQ